MPDSLFQPLTDQQQQAVTGGVITWDPRGELASGGRLQSIGSDWYFPTFTGGAGGAGGIQATRGWRNTRHPLLSWFQASIPGNIVTPIPVTLG